jgi:hypothetical protein
MADAYTTVHKLVEAVKQACSTRGWDAIPELIAVQGYSAGPVDASAADGWVLLYLDVTLRQWMLVRGADVFASDEVKDASLPFGGYNTLVVRREAPCRYGTGPYDVQGTFLAGSFTKAGDLEASSSTGGTFAPRSGLLCGVSTPECNRTPRC